MGTAVRSLRAWEIKMALWCGDPMRFGTALLHGHCEIPSWPGKSRWRCGAEIQCDLAPRRFNGHCCEIVLGLGNQDGVVVQRSNAIRYRLASRTLRAWEIKMALWCRDPMRFGTALLHGHCCEVVLGLGNQDGGVTQRSNAIRFMDTAVRSLRPWEIKTAV